MSDSSIDDDLFADDEVPAGEATGNSNIKYDPPPAYIEMSEFTEFVQENRVHVDKRYGYACVFLCRPFYFPG